MTNKTKRATPTDRATTVMLNNDERLMLKHKAKMLDVSQSDILRTGLEVYLHLDSQMLEMLTPIHELSGLREAEIIRRFLIGALAKYQARLQVAGEVGAIFDGPLALRATTTGPTLFLELFENWLEIYWKQNAGRSTSPCSNYKERKQPPETVQ